MIVADMVPATSLAVPLIGQYITFLHNIMQFKVNKCWVFEPHYSYLWEKKQKKCVLSLVLNDWRHFDDVTSDSKLFQLDLLHLFQVHLKHL